MTIARNTAAYWTAQLCNYALAFVSSVFTAVHLGPEHRGVVVAVILANTLTITLTNLGLQTLAMYFTGKTPERLTRIHTLIVWLVIAISAADLAAAGGLGCLVRAGVIERLPAAWHLEWIWLAAGLGVLPFSLYYYAAHGILAGAGRVQALSRFLFHYGAVMSAVNLVAVIMVPLSRPLLAAVLVTLWVLGQAASAVVLFLMLRHAGPVFVRIPFREGIREIGTMLSYGLRAFIGNFASGLVNRLDHVFILGAFGTAGIGLYNLSAKLAELVFHPSAAFENAAYSRVIAAERAESARLVQDLFRSNLLLNALIVGAMVVLARPLVVLVYREEYAGSVTPLLILLPGTMFLGCARMLAIYFSAQLGRPQIPSAIAWVTAAVNVAGLWWAVVHLRAGLAAAACVTTGSYAFMLCCYLVLFARATGLVNPAHYCLPQRRDLDRLVRLFRAPQDAA